MKKLANENEKISCIANTEEKYISFSKKIFNSFVNKTGKLVDVKFELRFIDSFKFMQTSLANLAWKTCE